MGGLNTTLNLGVHALDAVQGAIAATSNNIANVNTPGYTKEVAQLSESPLSLSGNNISGGGVTLNGIESVHDQLLNLQIQQQTSQESSANTESASLQQIQTYFTTTGTDIASALSGFSSSLLALSASPANSATQQAVLSSGQNLAHAFNATASGLTSAQSNANGLVTTSIAQINTLTVQIAKLNGQIQQLKSSGQSDNAAQDQLSVSVQQLAGLAGISVTHGSAGDMITTGSGTPLVMGKQSFTLQTTAGADGNKKVLDSNGTDITASIQGGQLGGALQMRDQVIPGMLLQLNSLAGSFASSFNAAQTQGVDSNGNQGRKFFSLPVDPTVIASGIVVSIGDPSLIAINSAGVNNGSSNVANLYSVLTQTLPTNASRSTVGTVLSPLSTASMLTVGAVTSIVDGSTGQTFSFTADATSTIGTLQTAIASAVAAGRLSSGTGLSFNSDGNAVISTTTAGNTLQVSTNDVALGQFQVTSGQTAAQAYASLVFTVGDTASSASTQSKAVGTTLLQLTDQKSAESGVNIDDETANLIRFQTAYQAAARIVNTIQQLSTVTMNMLS